MSSNEMVTSKDLSSFIDPEQVTDEQIQEDLSEKTVAEVMTLIERIIADKSVQRIVRRRAVSRVVENQAHPMKEFRKFGMWNEMARQDAKDSFQKASGFFAFIPIASLLWASALYLDGMDFWNAVSASFAGVSFMMALPVSILFYDAKRRLGLFEFERFNMTLDEFKAHQIEVAQKEMEEQKQQHQKTMEALGAVVGDGGSTVSLTQVKQDFAEVKLRIAEYETDLNKALSRPAFNDVNVPAVNTMVLQLRKCKRMFEDTSVHSVADIGDAVDKLWVDFTAAEQAAKKIAWSEVGEEEQRDLKLALQLVSQANDPGNTDAMRTNLYSRLRKIVNRLDSGGVTIHARVIEQIESKARLEVEQSRSERVHAV